MYSDESTYIRKDQWEQLEGTYKKYIRAENFCTNYWSIARNRYNFEKRLRKDVTISFLIS